jgi:myo-inositol-1(or 4)-monophosphatase
MTKTISKSRAAAKKKKAAPTPKRPVRKPVAQAAAKKTHKPTHKVAKPKPAPPKKTPPKPATQHPVQKSKAAIKRTVAVAPKLNQKAAGKGAAQGAEKPLIRLVAHVPATPLRKPLPRPLLPRPGDPSQGPPPRPKIVSKAKILPMDFLIELAKCIRDAVTPAFSAARGREAVGGATSGDVTFQIDKVAEKALLTFLKDAKLPVAYYSEDSGYTTFTSGQPVHLLVIDPIDGTRAAKNGFEWCCISVASTRVIERPAMGDIDNACVMEIATDRTFTAERGKGARVVTAAGTKKPKLNKNSDLESISWAMTVPARPAELIFPTAAKLIDLSSLKGGFFACNSTAYSLTRLVTTQLDACVDFANRFLRDIHPAVQDSFINAGRGATLGIAPYDLAAALLIAQEAGAMVTDAYGKSFDNVLLLDSSATNHRSMIAAANKDLYQKLWNFFDTRIKQFEQLLSRKVST